MENKDKIQSDSKARLTCIISAEFHKKLKVVSAMKCITMSEFVMDVVGKEIDKYLENLTSKGS